MERLFWCQEQKRKTALFMEKAEKASPRGWPVAFLGRQRPFVGKTGSEDFQDPRGRPPARPPILSSFCRRRPSTGLCVPLTTGPGFPLWGEATVRAEPLPRGPLEAGPRTPGHTGTNTCWHLQAPPPAGLARPGSRKSTDRPAPTPLRAGLSRETWGGGSVRHSRAWDPRRREHRAGSARRVRGRAGSAGGRHSLRPLPPPRPPLRPLPA